MLPVIIDISDYISQASFSEEQINSFARYTLSNITNEYMQIWEQLVDRELKRSKQQYKLGMNYEYIDDYNVVFKLEAKEDSKIALMIEEGASPFNQKPFFEKSNKRKESKDGGWYIHIPFRLATSEALGESNIFSGRLERPIENLVRRQEINPVTGFSIGLSRSQLPPEYRQTRIKPQIGTMTNTYEHRSPMFEGVMRGTREHHGQYLKFRTVSDNSDPNSWYHPGFEEHNFMGKALDLLQVDQIFERSKNEFIINE